MTPKRREAIAIPMATIQKILQASKTSSLGLFFIFNDSFALVQKIQLIFSVPQSTIFNMVLRRCDRFDVFKPIL